MLCGNLGNSLEGILGKYRASGVIGVAISSVLLTLNCQVSPCLCPVQSIIDQHQHQFPFQATAA